MESMIDVTAYTAEDLQEEYRLLFQRYGELHNINDENAQRIHELKRSLDTATAAEAYLAQELEQLTNSPGSIEGVGVNKMQTEVEEWKRKHNVLNADFLQLQTDYETISEENEELKKQLQSATFLTSSKTNSKELEQTSDESLERIVLLERENMELLEKLEEFNEKYVQNTLAIAEREGNIEMLRDQIVCLEENMKSKREELEEKTQLLESAQEQLAEANAQIAAMTASPDSHDRKGNSLFAEVDDQRQVMKQLLAAQKKDYLQMKKIFNESEYEIRRLKRENVAMHTELKTCSSIFCSADKTYQEKLNERIKILLNQNEDLERTLKWTQDRLKELANDKGVLWLDSMFNFCKQETADLKKQLHSVRFQKASLEEQLRNTQQDMARWRFESLKSRWVLSDRENLLTEHKISFKSIRDLAIRISEQELKTSRPSIEFVDNLATQTATPTPNINDRLPNKNDAVTSTVTINLDSPNIRDDSPNVRDKRLKLSPTESDLKRENEVFSPETPILPKYSKNSDDEIDTSNKENTPPNIDPGRILDHHRDIDQTSADLMQPFAFESKFRPIQLKMSPHALVTKNGPRHSIMAKTRSVFDNEMPKSVKFSTESPTVHEITPCKAIYDENTKEKVVETKNSKTIVTQMRTKSNIIVRRVVMQAKQENRS